MYSILYTLVYSVWCIVYIESIYIWIWCKPSVDQRYQTFMEQDSCSKISKSLLLLRFISHILIPTLTSKINKLTVCIMFVYTYSMYTHILHVYTIYLNYIRIHYISTMWILYIYIHTMYRGSRIEGLCTCQRRWHSHCAIYTYIL